MITKNAAIFSGLLYGQARKSTYFYSFLISKKKNYDTLFVFSLYAHAIPDVLSCQIVQLILSMTGQLSNFVQLNLLKLLMHLSDVFFSPQFSLSLTAYLF